MTSVVALSVDSAIGGRIFRIALVCFFWGGAFRLEGKILGDALARLSILTFWTYCSHYPINVFLGHLVGAVTDWQPGTWLSVTLFLISPFLAFACAGLLFKFVKNRGVFSEAATLMNGGRKLGKVASAGM